MMHRDENGTTIVNRVLDPDHWVYNYADQLFNYIMLRVSQREHAEDILQDCFLSAFRSRQSYNGSHSERTWLFAICKNKIIDHYRSHAVSASVSLDRYFDEEDHWTGNAAPLTWSDELMSRIDTPDFYKMLNLCRAKLSRTQYAVFTMKYLDQLETKEICSRLEITIQNYWILIHRARLQLRECLQQNWLNLK